jgi:hypothetical protein
MPEEAQSVEWTDDAIVAALESGDAEGLSKILKHGHDKRVISINPQIQKKLAKRLLEMVEYEIPEIIQKSTNPAVKGLEELKATLSASGNLTPEVGAAIDIQIENATKTSIKSDGVQKAFQACVVDLFADKLESMGKEDEADALRGAQESVVLFGAKRQMSKDEKKAYEKKKLATKNGNDDDDESEEE